MLHGSGSISRLSVGLAVSRLVNVRGAIHVRIVAGRLVRLSRLWPGPPRIRIRAGRLSRFEFDETHMASPFQIVLYSTDARPPDAPPALAFDRIAALNAILSDYDPESELSRLSLTAGGPAVAVSADLFDVLERSKQISRPIRRRLRRDDRPGRPALAAGPPRPQAARPPEARRGPSLWSARTSWSWTREARTVQLTKPGMKLDVGGIAKGYAAQAAIDVLESQGITRALVGGAGDIVVGDPPPDAAGWTIAIARLNPSEAGPATCILLKNAAVSTAGDAERFVIIDGHRYSHIINPVTGMGVEDRASVTVVAPDGATADALETTVYLLGPERGLKLVEAHAGDRGALCPLDPGRHQDLRVVAVQGTSPDQTQGNCRPPSRGDPDPELPPSLVQAGCSSARHRPACAQRKFHHPLRHALMIGRWAGGLRNLAGLDSIRRRACWAAAPVV